MIGIKEFCNYLEKEIYKCEIPEDKASEERIEKLLARLEDIEIALLDLEYDIEEEQGYYENKDELDDYWKSTLWAEANRRCD